MRTVARHNEGMAMPGGNQVAFFTSIPFDLFGPLQMTGISSVVAAAPT